MKSQSKERPLFFRLLLAFLGVTLSISALLVTVSYVFSSRSVEAHAREAVEIQLAAAGRMFEATYSDHLAKTLQRLIASTVLDDYLLGSEAVRLVTARKLERLFKQSARELEAIESIYFVDSQGRERVGISGQRRAVDLVDLGRLLQNSGSPASESNVHSAAAGRVCAALASLSPGSIYVDGPYLDALGKVSMLVGISKLDLDTGGFGGSVLIRLILDPFFDDLAELKLLGVASPIWIVSATGHVLRAPVNQDVTFHPEPALIRQLASEQAADKEVSLISLKQGLMAVRELSVVSGTTQLRLVACLADELLLNEVEPVLRFFSIVLSVSIVLIIVVAGWMARVLSSPIRRLADAALELAQGDLSTRVEVESASSEVRLLVDSFNTMAEARYRAEALLRVSEERFRSLVEQAADAMFVVDRSNGRFLEVNQQACVSLGYSREELLGLRVPEIQSNHSWEELAKKFQGLLPGESVTIEGNHRRKDGAKFPVEVRVGLFESGDQPLLVALARDISERRRNEQARQDAEEALERQRTLGMRADRLRSLGEMAAGIAHELNQPLVGVRGIAEHLQIALQKGWDLSDDMLLEKTGNIVAQADRMTHIIEHVRMFARESGKPDLSQLQVNEVVSAGIELLGAQLSTHGIELDADLAEELPPVAANPYSLEEVLINLLTNARDAIDERRQIQPSFYGRITVRTLARSNGGAHDLVCIEVGDNGPGIPEAVLPKIFDPFFTTKDPNKGTGLGLAICKSIIEQFAGHVSIESTHDSGTMATVALPVSMP